MYNFELEVVNLNDQRKVKKVKNFLKTFNLDYENVDATIIIYFENQIIATCSKLENLVKCIAVDPNFKNHNLTNQLITTISKMIYQQNYHEILIITKLENKQIFLDLNFFVILANQDIVFLTSDLTYYLAYQKYLSSQLKGSNKPIGLIVMNANPFTKGHEYLINYAVKKVTHLFIIMVKENKSLFNYEERKEMVILNTQSNSKITVLEGSDYIIANKIFPTYFAKDFEQASKFHAKMDAEIFCNLVTDFKKIIIRFVGEEPFSQTTNLYNQTLANVFLEQNLQLEIIPRLKINDVEVSASLVREKISKDQNVADLVPSSTLKFLTHLEIYQRTIEHNDLIRKNN